MQNCTPVAHSCVTLEPLIYPVPTLHQMQHTCASLSTDCKYQGRLEGPNLPQPITGATWKFHVLCNKQYYVLLLQLLGQMSQILEKFCCGSPPPFSIGKLDLQLFIVPCCGFLAAFPNHELFDSSTMQQKSQSKFLVSPLNRDRQSSAGLHGA